MAEKAIVYGRPIGVVFEYEGKKYRITKKYNSVFLILKEKDHTSVWSFFITIQKLSG